MTRSGFCTRCPRQVTDETARGPEHHRCRLDSCSCVWHLEDTRDAAAALVEGPVQSARSLSAEVEMLNLTASCLTKTATGLDETTEDAMRLLHTLRSALSQIRDVEAALVQHIYIHSDHGDVHIDGLPAAKVTRARDRKAWEHRPLAQAVLDAHMTERGFEQPDPWEAIGWVLDAAGVSYWKLTALRELGIEVDQYCETSPGKVSVQFIE